MGGRGVSGNGEEMDRLDELKASVLLGEVALDDPRVRSLPSAEQDELRELLDVCASLEEHGAAGASESTADELTVGVGDEAIARRFLESVDSADEPRRGQVPPTASDPSVDSHAPMAPAWGRWGGLVALAAGVILVVWGITRRADTPETPGDPPVGTGTLRAESGSRA